MDKLRRRTTTLLPFLLVGAIFVAAAGPSFGYGRAAIAFLVAAPILALGIGYFRSAGDSAPEPAAVETDASDVRYVCSVCGLELKVVVATNGRAPTHCREHMELVTAGETPPLKSV